MGRSPEAVKKQLRRGIGVLYPFSGLRGELSAFEAKRGIKTINNSKYGT